MTRPLRPPQGYCLARTFAVFSCAMKASDQRPKAQDVMLGHITSSTDFMLPYTFGVELMGDRATLRQDFLQTLEGTVDIPALQAANPFPADVRLEPDTDRNGRPGVRINCRMPESADVSHHPFQAEMDELVACILEGRETSINVFDAQKTMEICIASDQSGAQGGKPVALPLLGDG